MEKKDLLIYINIKIEILEQTLINITKFRKRDRAKISHRIMGRIKELKKLKTIIHDNRIKDASKRLWKDAEALK